jgi:hypothetical protein
MKKSKAATEVANDEGLLERIKKTALVAMVSDDNLMDILVLKGGNALHLVHKLSTRFSMDLDFSMEKDFFDGKIEEHQKLFEKVLNKSFARIGFKAFDVVLLKKPKEIPDLLKSFWGATVTTSPTQPPHKRTGLAEQLHFDRADPAALRDG